MRCNVDTSAVKIGVVGAGSWGTAIAELLASKGFRVDLWVYEQHVKDQIEKNRENKVFLPGAILSSNIFPSLDLTEVVLKKDLLFLVVPSHVMRDMARRIGEIAAKDTIIISAAKGIENKTHLTMSGVIKDVIPGLDDRFLAVLSGPSFAAEVVRKVPTLIAVASSDSKTALFVQHVLSTPYLRAYTSDDVVGVELGGAVKNVIAIAAGIADGLNLGLNTRAALITRGLNEIRRLGLKLGAKPLTFIGLAGAGDLILTCTGDLSRNHTVGKLIGEGKKLKDILSKMDMVAEGVKTAKSVYNLSTRIGLEMPICHETYHILYDDVSPKDAIFRLMTRDLKNELDEY